MWPPERNGEGMPSAVVERGWIVRSDMVAVTARKPSRGEDCCDGEMLVEILVMSCD